jgi:NDP-sugar pyrophosphorylase family protein
MSREDAIQLMRTNRIHQIPVVDSQHRVVGLHLLDDLIEPEEKNNCMVIMAGGRGTRLLPHTESCPKPLLMVAGKPMLEHILTRARQEGFRRFIVAVHYLGEMIKDHFGDGSRWSIRIDYLEERQPLGTAGALSLLQPKPSEPVLVTNGDILTDIRYRELLEFHQRHRAAATMAVRLHEWQQPYGVVETQGMEIVGFAEKPIVKSRVNAGIYVLEPSSLAALVPGEFCDMPMLFQKLQRSGARTIVYPMHEPWMDVGRPKDLDQANHAVSP